MGVLTHPAYQGNPRLETADFDSLRQDEIEELIPRFMAEQPPYRPVHTGGRFSKNAVVPSFLSSVAHSRPKISASTSMPSRGPERAPRRTASRQPATA